MKVQQFDPPPEQTPHRDVHTTLSFLQDLLAAYHPRNFAIRLWEGTTWQAEPGHPTRFTLVLQHPGALRKMFWPPNEVALGEAYIYGDFDIEGDLEAVFGLAKFFIGSSWGLAERLRYGKALFSLPSSGRSRVGHAAARLNGAAHSQPRAKQAATYHYNVSNDFYALWLDQRMVYTCAYFTNPDEDLDTVQERKLDYVCRKLRLRQGERLLDIGCGWGGLVRHAVQHYGVEALGITLSQPQADLANERARQAGIADRCRIEVRDYRDLQEPESFDKLVSIGMVEHVGEAFLPAYFAQAMRLLRPGGVFLNHGIGCHPQLWVPRKQTFTLQYVFPDVDVVPLSKTVQSAEEAGFEVRDVENLREHYIFTLRHWLHRLEAHHEAIRQIVDEATYRAWRLFFAGAAYRFQIGMLNLHQTLLVKPDNGVSGLPFTRADWYS